MSQSKRAREKKKEKRKKIIEGIRRVVSIINARQRIPNKKSDRIGFESEDRALQAAKYLRKKRIISSVRLSKRFSPDDLAGKDLTIRLNNGEIIYFQITSSYRRDVEIVSQDKGIFYLPVYFDDKDETIRNKLFQTILYAYFSELEWHQRRIIINTVLKTPFAKEHSQERLIERVKKFFANLVRCII